jgi:peroxiredoxin Q/BCP
VFLKPDAPDEIAKWLGKTDEKDTFTVYQDEGAKLATAFGVPDGYKFQGQTVHYPALILLDGAGSEVFRYVGKNNGDRLPFDNFEAKLAELRKSKWCCAGGTIRYTDAS